MKDTYDFDNLIFQLTKNPRDIYYRKLKHQNQICFPTYKQFLKYFIYLIELNKDKITVDCKD